jgi:hypothetical protein
MRTFILTLLICLIALPAFAVTPQESNALPPPDITTKRKGMEASGALATRDQANEYYHTCTTDNARLAQLNPIARDMMCSCVAAGIEAEMTEEDYKQMTRVTEKAGRAAFTKLLEKVYMPCANTPLDQMIRNDCSKRYGGPAAGRTALAGCNCVANRVALYVQKVGVADILYTVQLAKKFSEPFDILTNTSGYQSELLKGYAACFGGNY